MSVRRLPAVAVTGAVLVAGMAARRARARALADRVKGSPPAFRTDDGVHLHVETAGSSDAPVTVVLSHGFGARATMFGPQWSALGGCARLIRYDQRGHGSSGWAGPRSATVDRLGRDLGQLVDELTGDGPVVLAGHSMGGMAVLALAGQRPELFGTRIAGVALLSTRAAPLPEVGSTAGPPRVRMALFTAGAWLIWLAAPLIGMLRPVRANWTKRLVGRRLFAGDPPRSAVRAVLRMSAAIPAGVLSAYLTGLARYDQRHAVDVLRAVPVLVLAGTDDATIPARSAERLAEEIGDLATLVLVNGAGHMVNLTHPDTVNSALEQLLARIRADSDERSTR